MGRPYTVGASTEPCTQAGISELWKTAAASPEYQESVDGEECGRVNERL